MIIDEMKKITSEFYTIDPNISEDVLEVFNKEIKVLTRSLEDTIYFLKNADEETIWLSCTAWNEVSKHFNSRELVDCMKDCVKKFPNNQEILDINANNAEKELK